MQKATQIQQKRQKRQQPCFYWFRVFIFCRPFLGRKHDHPTDVTTEPCPLPPAPNTGTPKHPALLSFIPICFFWCMLLFFTLCFPMSRSRVTDFHTCFFQSPPFFFLGGDIFSNGIWYYRRKINKAKRYSPCYSLYTIHPQPGNHMNPLDLLNLPVQYH